MSEHIDSSWGESVFDKLSKSTYQYDDKGNKVSSTYSENDKFGDGTFIYNTTNTICQYDKDGFITQQSTQTNDIERDNSTVRVNSTEQDQYDQGRLTRKLTVVNSSAAEATTSLINYLYDSSGRLLKEVDTANNYPYENIIYTYTGGTLSEIVNTHYDGTKTNPYFELNAHGLFTKTIEGTN